MVTRYFLPTLTHGTRPLRTNVRMAVSVRQVCGSWSLNQAAASRIVLVCTRTDYWPTYLGGKETVRKHFYFSAAAQKTRKLTPAKKLKFGDIECFKQWETREHSLRSGCILRFLCVFAILYFGHGRCRASNGSAWADLAWQGVSQCTCTRFGANFA